MNSGQSQRQSLKTLLQPPMLNLGSPKDKPVTASHTRFGSTSMVSSNSGLGGPQTHFDITLPNFPLSPKPATATPLGTGEYTCRSQKSMRLIKRISSFAKNASKDFETKVKIINNIERRKIQALSTDKLFNINQSPNQAIGPHKSLGDIFAKPSGPVFSEEISLVEKKKAPLLVEHHRFVYFQIDCARFPSPLVINIFKGADTATNTKLKVYVSKTNKKPSALSCDYSVESRNVKIYEKDYKSHFETPTYHFGVYSENRFEGTIIFFFGEEASRPTHTKAQSLFMSPRAKLKMKVAEDTITSEEIREIQKERFLKRWALSKGQNMVEMNKHPLTPKEREYSFHQKRMVTESRINEVLMNKKLRDEEKMQKKLYSIGKHDMIKSIRDYVDTQRDIVLTKQAFQKDWLIISTFLTMMHYLRNHFKVKKAAYKKRQEIYLRFHFFIIKYKRNLHKKGETLRQRLMFDIRSSLECHARALLDAKRAEYTNYVAAAFRDFKMVTNIACRFLRPGTIVKKVEDRWTNFKAKKNLYYKLFGLMWDRFHRATLAEFSPTSPSSKPQFFSKKSFERKTTIAVEKKAIVLPASPKAQPEDKRAKFIKYMMEILYYKYNKAFNKYRLKLATLDPEHRKMADYAKFFLVEQKILMKNTLISKIERLDIHALNVEDLGLGNKALVLYRRKDLIRPPRLFCIPREEEIKQAIINIARGDDEVRSLDSIDDNDY